MSIRSKLLLLFLTIAVVPMLSIGAFIFSNARSNLEQATLRGLNMLAEGKEAELLSFINSKKERVIDFASDGFIRDEAERIADIKDPGDIRGASEALNTHLRVNKQPLDRDIGEIHIFNMEGKIIGTTEEDGEELGSYKEKNQPHFLRGRKETYVQDVHFYRHHGVEEAFIAISTPLKSRTSDRIIGVLMNRYRLENIKDILIGKRVLLLGAPTALNISGNNMDIFLVNQEGLMILPSKDMADFKPLRHKMDAIEPVARCINAGEEINKGWTSLKGNKVLGSSMCMQVEKDWKWVLVVEQDEAEALAPIIRFRNLSTLIGMIA